MVEAAHRFPRFATGVDPQDAPTRIEPRIRSSVPVAEPEPALAEAPPRRREFAPVEGVDGLVDPDVGYSDDDEFFDAAIRRRKHLRRAAIAVGVLAACLVVKLAWPSGDAAPALAPVIKARHLALIPPLPRAPEALAAAVPGEPATASAKAGPARGDDAIAAADKKAHAAAPQARELPATGTTQVFAAPPPVVPAIEVVKPDAAPKDNVQLAYVDAKNDEPSGRPSVLVSTTPAGAITTVDGRYVGRTPLTVRWEVGHATDIELALPGYTSKSIHLKPDAKSGVLKVTLVKEAEPADEEPAPTPAKAPKTPAHPVMQLPDPIATPLEGKFPEPTRMPEPKPVRH